MFKRLTREQLYELVWTEPVQGLSRKLELTELELTKLCRRARIPVPARSYWSKLETGRPVLRQALPLRPPGMQDLIEIGSSSSSFHFLTEEQIVNQVLNPPVFSESIEELAARVSGMVGKIKAPRSLKPLHPQIGKLLKADELRRQKQQKGQFPMPSNAPVFDSPFERRRLRILNALFVELTKHGVSPGVEGREGRHLSVRVGDTHISFALDHALQSYTHRWEYQSEANVTPDGRLKLVIPYWWNCTIPPVSWEDSPQSSLEECLSEIVVQLLLAGEIALRHHAEEGYKFKVRHKAKVLETLRARREQALQEKRERLEHMENERIQDLLKTVQAWRQAEEIRAYVNAIVSARANQGSGYPEPLRQWEVWALVVADRLDPLLKKKRPDFKN